MELTLARNWITLSKEKEENIKAELACMYAKSLVRDAEELKTELALYLLSDGDLYCAEVMKHSSIQFDDLSAICINRVQWYDLSGYMGIDAAEVSDDVWEEEKEQYLYEYVDDWVEDRYEIFRNELDQIYTKQRFYI